MKDSRYKSILLATLAGPAFITSALRCPCEACEARIFTYWYTRYDLDIKTAEVQGNAARMQTNLLYSRVN